MLCTPRPFQVKQRPHAGAGGTCLSPEGTWPCQHSTPTSRAPGPSSLGTAPCSHDCSTAVAVLPPRRWVTHTPHMSFLQPCNVPLFWWDRCSMKRSTQNPQPRERDDAVIRHFLGLLFGGLVWFMLNTCCLLHCLQHPGHHWLLHSCPPVPPDLLEPLYDTSLFNLAQHRPAWIFPLSGSHKIDTMLRGSL